MVAFVVSDDMMARVNEQQSVAMDGCYDVMEDGSAIY